MHVFSFFPSFHLKFLSGKRVRKLKDNKMACSRMKKWGIFECIIRMIQVCKNNEMKEK